MVRSIPAWAGEPCAPDCSYRRWTVYPRVGGGTRRFSSASSHIGGLSPRGRGNPGLLQGVGDDGRSIPAWAGEPLYLYNYVCKQRVYPRVGGGTSIHSADDVSQVGLSPRGRGNREFQGRRLILLRSIPAWAGEPVSIAPMMSVKSVYPRVGGGTANFRPPSDPVAVYPRVGGGTIPLGLTPYFPSGLSPRGRGNLGGGSNGNGVVGSIPAWAGEPQAPSRPDCSTSVYPRVGGGTSGTHPCGHCICGLSPRGRGNQRMPGADDGIRGSIPAWAGEPASAGG